MPLPLNPLRPRLMPVWALGLALVAGCGHPQVAPVNLRLTASLRTALSARNEEWLAQNEKLVEERHQAGQMGDDEYASFRAIIDQARGGDWEGAERESVALQKAQRPSQEQVDQLPMAPEE